MPKFGFAGKVVLVKLTTIEIKKKSANSGTGR